MINLETKSYSNDFSCTSDKEITDLIFKNSSEASDVPWGTIYKGDAISKMFNYDVEVIRDEDLIKNLSCSVAVAEMKPGAYHSPFIRHVGKVENHINKRVYRVVSGSFICVRDGEIKEYTSKDEYIVVGDFDIFSFKAGDNGCVFVIFDFPEFDETQDTNDITFKK
ncbi:hypothetical protein M0R04_01425 [Candidatus Dojkabacteria bacterium]|jgi:hypothetical protein|nr:hypothetical protein [Candidatus Dojkabacteria bacterium]